ncbi:hypothetical protein WMY93_003594 [Mugilogobius chulae]|uniref:ATPase family AAA domain-containing protein 5 n=1 Tax=Mugilogobius chulae TaxID=88201 RepID=A0AAW0PX50_9GOBI
MSKPGNKEQSKAKEEQTVLKKKPVEVDSKNTCLKSPSDVLAKDGNTEESSKKTATSLILFEEVDVIFEEDTGFLNAIKTFMMTTKRPVILTTSDPAFSAMFDGNFEEIVFKPPSMLNVASYLQLLCLAENVRTDLKDITSVLSLNSCDIRKTLLQLQFWTRSGGQRTITPPNGQKELLKAQEVAVYNPLPICETGCTESMMGLLNIAPQQNIWELLTKQEAEFANLVTLSRQQGVNLLYSNMERLLDLPTTKLALSNHKPPQCFLLHRPNPNSHHTPASRRGEDRVERRNSLMQSCAFEIHAQVESLSFNKCSASVSNAWHKVQQMDEALREKTIAQLTLPVASHNESYTFTQNNLCNSEVVQRRREVMDELDLKAVFGSVGSRPTAAQDYLPTLRVICRSEQLKEQGKSREGFCII